MKKSRAPLRSRSNFLLSAALLTSMTAALATVSPSFGTETSGPDSASSACAEALRFRFGWELELTPAQYSLLMTELDLDFFESKYPWEITEEHPEFDLILATYLTHSKGLEAIRTKDPQLYATLEKRFGLNEKLLIQTSTGVLRPEPAPLPREFEQAEPAPRSGIFTGSVVLLPNSSSSRPTAATSRSGRAHV